MLCNNSKKKEPHLLESVNVQDENRSSVANLKNWKTKIYRKFGVSGMHIEEVWLSLAKY